MSGRIVEPSAGPELIKDPFCISDDLNRFPVIFYLLLLPGKLVVFAFQTLHKFFKYNL